MGFSYSIAERRTAREFKERASVVTADEQQVCRVDRVVIGPKTKEVTHIVVRKGLIFTEDKVVPINLVASATEDRVTLREDAGDLQIPVKSTS